MRVLSFFSLMAFLACFLAPAFAQTQDDHIHDQVMQRLASDRDVKGGGIDVEVANGVVTLSGKVREQKQKEKAERIARKVKGVKNVVNNLVIEMGPRPTPEPSKK